MHYHFFAYMARLKHIRRWNMRRVEWAQVSKIYPEEEDESDAGAEKSAS